MNIRQSIIVSLLSLVMYVTRLESVVGQRDMCIDLTARFAMAAPDGVEKEVITINNQFPGPTIRVKKYDTVTIRVRNHLIDRNRRTHPTSVHFHGIEMMRTPWFDGPEQVAQCPIPYGQVMNYTFTLQQSGTYWYHSHHSWQYIDGFWGLLIVENDPVEVHKYDDELSLTLMDWHHQSGADLSKLLNLPRTPSEPKAGMTPVPDSALINGYGNADCELAREGGHTCDQDMANLVTVFDVVPWRTYRIRVVNPSARAMFRFSIDGLKLRAIETDGVDTVEGEPVDEVDIWPAQRYSFLVTMSRTTFGRNYWIRAGVRVGTGNQTRIGNIQPLAVLHYLGSGPPRQRGILSPTPNQPSQGSLTGSRSLPFPFSSVGGGSQGRPATHEIGVPGTKFVQSNFAPIVPFPSSQQQVLENTCARFEAPLANNDRSQNVRINKEYLQVFSYPNPSSTSVLLDQNNCRSMERVGFLDSAPQYYDKEIVLNAQFHVDQFNKLRGLINGASYSIEESAVPAVFRAIKGDPIPDYFRPVETPALGQVVQLVINNLNGTAGTGGHPWHLHGHTFWVLGTGRAGDGPYNPARDSGRLNIVGLRRDTTHTPPNSWTVVRYRVDSPGVWLMHCHIHWHLEIGLAAVFIEGRRQLRFNLQIPPEARRICSANGIQI